MTTLDHPHADGNLPAAKQQLHDAITKLIAPQPHTHHIDTEQTQITWLDSPYHQLQEALDKQRTNGTRIACSQLPLSIDALELLTEIDTTIHAWQPTPTKTHTTQLLHHLQNRKWRPQDTHSINQITSCITNWTERIKNLLNPQHIKHVSAPCPACGAKTWTHRDNTGELVRSPALQIIANQGCTCMHCKTTWTPDLYLHLSRVLGFDMPEGVLE